MSEVVRGNTPASDSGREALGVVRDVLSRYLALDMSVVQEACEAERLRKLAEWQTSSDQTVLELNVPRVIAIEEATPAFELYMPRRVTLLVEETKDFYGAESDGTPKRAAQATSVNDDAREAIITTYMRWVTHYLGELWVLDPVTMRVMTSLKLSTVHELAHASGDHPPRVALDSVRGYIAVQAIGRLLGEVIDSLSD